MGVTATLPLCAIFDSMCRLYQGIGSEIKDDLINRPFNSYYPDMGPEDEWYKKGFFVRDEQGQYILQNDSRLHDKEYFVVPLDMHS
jgi:hypothetical protein